VLETRDAIAQAAERYRPAGRWAYGFARGKMGNDPAYQRVLELLQGHEQGTLVDVGCGEGHLLALARALYPELRLFGVDHDGDRVDTARVALEGFERLSLEAGDARTVELPGCQVLCCLDVLHYMSPEDQDLLLTRFAEALEPGGILLIRDGREGAGLRSTLTRLSEQLAVALGRHKGEGVHFRDAEATRATLSALGLEVELQDCAQGTPFANVLWIGRKPESTS
jgi:SAM-dependent methyltransferase